jgi:hypothetical protein
MAKKNGLDRRSGYYQTITKYFIDLRGAPFFLSSKELDMVRQWEERGIPLRVVLEGIRQSFEQTGYRHRKRRRPLDYCHSFVLRAFEQHEDRRIGRKKARAFQGEKGRNTRICLEVEKFLAEIPEELHSLRPVYVTLHKKLSGGKVTEAELEKAEETIERLMEESLSDAQKESLTTEIRSEFGKIGGSEFEQIFRIKALRRLRDKHKIPHVSPFYY